MVDWFFVQKRGPSDALSIFAKVMFHGTAKRPGAPYPLHHYSFTEKPVLPLHVCKNTFGPPRIFAPNIDWIVPAEAQPEQYPIYWNSGFVVRGDVFAFLRPWLDPSFFRFDQGL